MRARYLFHAVALMACAGQAGAPVAPSPALDATAQPHLSEQPTPGVRDDCPYLPEFRQLEPTLMGLPPAQAAAQWDRYMASHDNPEGCEATEIDRRLGTLEKALFVLASNGRRIPSQAVFRCNRFDPVTARCDEPLEDGTTGPIASEANTPVAGIIQPFELLSERPAANLTGIYTVSLGDALEGRPATHLTTPATAVTLPPGAHDIALMAIFQTDGAWRYRKAVWYF